MVVSSAYPPLSMVHFWLTVFFFGSGTTIALWRSVAQHNMA